MQLTRKHLALAGAALLVLAVATAALLGWWVVALTALALLNLACLAAVVRPLSLAGALPDEAVTRIERRLDTALTQLNATTADTRGEVLELRTEIAVLTGRVGLDETVPQPGHGTHPGPAPSP